MPPLLPPTLVTLEPITPVEIDVLKTKLEDFKKDSTALTEVIDTSSTEERISGIKSNVDGSITNVENLVNAVRNEFQEIETLLSTTTSATEIASKLPPETLEQVKTRVSELANRNLITEKIFRKQYPRLYNLLIK